MLVVATDRKCFLLIIIVFSIGVACEAERDSVWGLVFPATVAGFSYSQQCPQNGNGTTLGITILFHVTVC